MEGLPRSEEKPEDKCMGMMVGKKGEREHFDWYIKTKSKISGMISIVEM